VDAHDGVRVIDRAREHARELGGAEALLERGDLRFRLGDRRIVVPVGAKFEKDVRVLDVARQFLDRGDELLDAGTLPRDGLRLLGVVPEPGSERRVA
jgi:hypothetical protein